MSRRQHALFQPNEDARYNAAVGLNGGPYGFGDYSLGYFDSAERLFKSIQENWVNIDVLVYPLTFLYRHAVELGLKHMVRELAVLRGEAAQVNLNHRLLDNWQIVRDNLHLLGNINYRDAVRLWSDNQIDLEESNDEIIAMLDNAIRDLSMIDESSMVFRYPEDRAGGLYLQDVGVINVLELVARMMFTHNIFQIWFEIAREELSGE